jgi:lipid A 3-O-deacylase
LTPTAKFFVLTICVMTAGLVASAQNPVVDSQPNGEAVDTLVYSWMLSTPPDSPVSEVRKERNWEYAPFVNYGNGIGGDRSNYHFFSLGFEAGKILTPPIHAGILSGQFQLAVNVMPFWQAYTPAPHVQTFVYQGVIYREPVGGGTYTGASLTPVIFRWNFLTHSKRVQPWFQAAGGLVYTTHKFPPDVLVPHGTPGATSVWNFSPQGGVGVHYFTRPKRSIDLGVNAVHISSASLGDHNPGVNASIQVQVGYTFWR